MGRLGQRKHVSDVQREFSGDFTVINDSLLLCKFCDTVVNWKKKTRIYEHLQTRHSLLTCFIRSLALVKFCLLVSVKRVQRILQKEFFLKGKLRQYELPFLIHYKHERVKISKIYRYEFLFPKYKILDKFAQNYLLLAS